MNLLILHCSEILHEGLSLPSEEVTVINGRGMDVRLHNPH